MVESRRADVVGAGSFVPRESPEGVPHLLLIDGEGGRGSRKDGVEAGACLNLPYNRLRVSRSGLLLSCVGVGFFK